jgi:hypothetical protein
MRTFRLFLLSTTLVLAASLAVLADGGQQQTSQDAQQGLRRFSGTPIDVDYQSANLRTVLRNLAETRACRPTRTST